MDTSTPARLAHLDGHRTVGLAACHARIAAVLAGEVAAYTGHEHTLATVALRTRLDRVLDGGMFGPEDADVRLVGATTYHDSDAERQDAVIGLLDTSARRIPPAEEHR